MSNYIELWTIYFGHACMLSHFSYVWLFATPWTQPTGLLCPWDSLKQEYWSRLPCPLPGYPPDPGIKPVSLISLALAGGIFTTEPPGKALFCPYMFIFAGTVLNTKISALITQITCSYGAHVPLWERHAINNNNKINIPEQNSAKTKLW